MSSATLRFRDPIVSIGRILVFAGEQTYHALVLTSFCSSLTSTDKWVPNVRFPCLLIYYFEDNRALCICYAYTITDCSILSYSLRCCVFGLNIPSARNSASPNHHTSIWIDHRLVIVANLIVLLDLEQCGRICTWLTTGVSDDMAILRIFWVFLVGSCTLLHVELSWIEQTYIPSLIGRVEQHCRPTAFVCATNLLCSISSILISYFQ